MHIRVDCFAKLFDLTMNEAFYVLCHHPRAAPLDIPGWWSFL